MNEIFIVGIIVGGSFGFIAGLIVGGVMGNERSRKDV